jgi:hypothetical protein
VIDESTVTGFPKKSRSGWFKKLWGWLVAFFRYPLVIAGAAALLGAVVIPSLFRSWQDRQTANSIKRDLLDEISTSTFTSLGQAQALAQGSLRAAGGTSGDSPNTVYLRVKDSWATQRAEARSQILVYFPDLYECWYSFDSAMSDYISLSTIPTSRTAKSPSSKSANFAEQLRDRMGREKSLRDYISNSFNRSYVPPGSGLRSSPDKCKSLTALPLALQERFAHLEQKTHWKRLALLPTRPGFINVYDIVGEELSIDMDRISSTIARASL